MAMSDAGGIGIRLGALAWKRIGLPDSAFLLIATFTTRARLVGSVHIGCTVSQAKAKLKNGGAKFTVMENNDTAADRATSKSRQGKQIDGVITVQVVLGEKMLHQNTSTRQNNDGCGTGTSLLLAARDPDWWVFVVCLTEVST